MEDWTAKAARRIRSEMLVVVPAHEPSMVGLGPSEERIAAIIEASAEPIVALLKESGRGVHSKGYNEEACDCPPCPKSDDAWNARVEAALEGRKP